MSNNNELKQIETSKLEKIHYAQLKIIEERKKAGLVDGQKLEIKNPGELYKLKKLLDDIFSKADQEKPCPGNSELLGIHYYVAVLKNLPLSKVMELENKTAQEIKRRRELCRQRLDAGNIDKIVKEEIAK